MKKVGGRMVFGLPKNDRSRRVPLPLSAGVHVLRHFYASALLDAGESVKALSEYLGHADPGFTLRVHPHLTPAREDRTRRAISVVR